MNGFYSVLSIIFLNDLANINFVSSDRELTRLGMNGEYLSEDDDGSSDDDSPMSGGSVGDDDGDSDDNKLVGQRSPPAPFDDALSAEVELMKAMGLPLGFSGYRGTMVAIHEVGYPVLLKTSSSSFIIGQP